LGLSLFRVLSTIVQTIAPINRQAPQAAILPRQSLVPGLLLLFPEEPTSAAGPSLSPEFGDPAMKTTLLVLCLLCTTAALAQYAGSASYISSEPQIYQ